MKNTVLLIAAIALPFTAGQDALPRRLRSEVPPSRKLYGDDGAEPVVTAIANAVGKADKSMSIYSAKVEKSMSYSGKSGKSMSMRSGKSGKSENV